MSAVMEKGKLTTENMVKYLNLYIGETSWEDKLAHLYNRVLLPKLGEKQAKITFKESVAFAILGQEYASIPVPDELSNALYRISWAQFKERDDWVALLEKRIKDDIEIESSRDQCLSLGIVHPLDYSPVTRQAYNWLYGKAEDSGVVTEENKKDIVRRFQNLVYAYGGNVVCYIFMKEETKVKKKVLNWRSNYFFERLIFDVYTLEQILKIKKQELNKTNSKLVKKVRVD